MADTVTVTIDGRAVAVPAGASVLEATRRLGLDVPTLCYLERCGPLTSCLVCLVKVKAGAASAGRLVPACGTPVIEGMVIESETPEVHDARRTALELLFSDHVGDCLSPCHRICPLQLNIPVMLRQIDTGRLDRAIVTVKQALPLPAILGRLCHRPCENGCRRGTHDQPAAIRELERMVADHDLEAARPYLPVRKSGSGKSVAIVGAGPTGLAAAYFLLREGHNVVVHDRRDRPGGSLRRELGPDTLPTTVLDAEIQRLEALGATFRLEHELGRDSTLDSLRAGFDAVLVALGESGRTQAAAWGLATTPAGIQVQADSRMTCLDKVFAAGSAVKPLKQVVRAMAEGRAGALAIHQYLTGAAVRAPDKPFSSVMGRLDPAELKRFLVGPSPAPRVSPALGLLRGFDFQEAAEESRRCLHCDCRAAGNCQLQHYAELYGAEPGRFRSARRPFEQHLQHGEIVFEPGKCILCGICLRLAELAREPLGLTFIERGFDVRVAAPFDRTIADGLQKVGRECVEACPTGALAFKDDYLRHLREHGPAPGAGCGGCSHGP